jgi:uncharacterized protein (TIGR03437 family)
MKKFQLKIAPVFILTMVSSVVLVPLFHAQNLGSTVSVYTDPDGASFSVDGQNYTHAMSAIWPAGSKHVLSVDSNVQLGQPKTRYTFGGWSYSLGQLTGNTVTVSADPAFTYYKGRFTLEYALTLVFFSCLDATNCQSPGVISVSGQSIGSSGDIYLAAGSTATLIATPNPGWVFTGWEPGYGQDIHGPINKVTMNGPVSVYPLFRQARNIKLATAPNGLEILADRTKVPTPTVMEWGWDTSHTLGVITPQLDNAGKWWAFQSWSDGGASTHAYQVAESLQPDSVTATFVAGASTLLTTSPAGLALKVDGRSNWPSYGFIWGIGETHHLEAPAQQTDAQGRVWAFSSWSNGGPAVQDFTVPANGADIGVHLTATYNPVGHLTVTSSLPSLTVYVDGSSCATPCDVVRPVGTAVHVSAPSTIPVADGVRADFTGWPGSGSTATDWSLTLTGDPVTLLANYHTMNRLAASSAPPQGATWSMTPSSPDGFYDTQAIVSVGVTPLPGFRFHGWSGDLTGTRPAGVLAMTSPRSVEALLDRAPYIAPTGVSNAAGTTPQAGLAPGSVASVFGASFATDMTAGPASPLAQTLGGVTVRVGDRFLPLIFVSPTQINLQLPDDLALGAQTLTVSSQGLPDVQAGFTVVRNAPGLFAQVVNDQSFAVVVHEDGSPVTTDAPALHGELLTVYGTGFGPADHARPEGFAVPSDPAYLIVDSPSVLVGGAILGAANAFAAPGRIGIDAVQFRLDDTAPSGTIAPLHVIVNGQDSNTVMLPVQ